MPSFGRKILEFELLFDGILKSELTASSSDQYLTYWASDSFKSYVAIGVEQLRKNPLIVIFIVPQIANYCKYI